MRAKLLNHTHSLCLPRPQKLIAALYLGIKMVSEVLSLYRAILRLGGKQLKLTDSQYFRKLVKDEFRKNRRERRPDELKFQKQVWWWHKSKS